jgi:hypothetical protein
MQRSSGCDCNSHNLNYSSTSSCIVWADCVKSVYRVGPILPSHLPRLQRVHCAVGLRNFLHVLSIFTSSSFTTHIYKLTVMSGAKKWQMLHAVLSSLLLPTFNNFNHFGQYTMHDSVSCILS